MKLLRYLHNGFAKTGVFHQGLVRDLPTQLSITDILAMPLRERQYLETQCGKYHRTELEKVHLLPPIEPRAMRDFVAFEAHIMGMQKRNGPDARPAPEWYEAPTFLFMNPWSLTDPYGEVVPPADAKDLDFELEIGAVVSKRTRDIDAKDAAGNIGGYLILNDWSARDLQGREMRVGLGPSKGKDFANTIGPWITTSEELEARREGDRYDLEMKVFINDKLIGSDNAKNMSWSFEEMLAYASRGAIVGEGDILGTGTCSQGALAEFWSRRGKLDPAPLKPGDVVRMEIDILGMIENKIAKPNKPAAKVPPARQTYGDDRLHW